MAMTLYGRTMHRAVGTAAALGVFVAVPGAIGYVLAGWPQMAQLPPFSAGFVSLIGFVLIAPTSMAFAPLGARIAHRFSRRALEVSFGLFLFAVAARFIASLIWS
ncbi:MAG TPA: TSUP family transporter, partial [Xanthobacteraceae bacterium]|nr:TSUP family transporter [Xanthobacteraceae bacterium]